jgi:hypothetical protein
MNHLKHISRLHNREDAGRVLYDRIQDHQVVAKRLCSSGAAISRNCSENGPAAGILIDSVASEKLPIIPACCRITGKQEVNFSIADYA